MLPLIRPARIPTRETSQIAGQWKKKGLIRLCDRNKKKKTTTKFPNSILLTLLVLRVISIKFLLVISILCKTEWSWELQTWSHKMYLLDTLSASPHYFCRKWIGATNENSYFDLSSLWTGLWSSGELLFFSPDREPVHRLDLRDYRVNAKEQTVQSENNGNITEFHPQTQRLKYRLNI